MTQRSPSDFWHSSMIINSGEKIHPLRKCGASPYANNSKMLAGYELDDGYNYSNHMSQASRSFVTGQYASNAGVVSLPTWSSIQTSQPPAESSIVSQQELCQVCDDVSTGKHFGVLSCEACKSFFRRSIRSSARYVCKGGIKCCRIDMYTRSKCQYCRLQKCFDVGMNQSGKY